MGRSKIARPVEGIDLLKWFSVNFWNFPLTFPSSQYAFLSLSLAPSLCNSVTVTSCCRCVCFSASVTVYDCVIFHLINVKQIENRIPLYPLDYLPIPPLYSFTIDLPLTDNKHRVILQAALSVLSFDLNKRYFLSKV